MTKKRGKKEKNEEKLKKKMQKDVQFTVCFQNRAKMPLMHRGAFEMIVAKCHCQNETG